MGWEAEYTETDLHSSGHVVIVLSVRLTPATFNTLLQYEQLPCGLKSRRENVTTCSVNVFHISCAC